jgi:hypothetical protein
MPKGLYRLCHTRDCDPVLITTKMMMPTSRQTKHYLLCEDCEARLNQDGENWVLPTLATVAGAFPFFSLLQKQEPLFTLPDVTAYAVSNNLTINKKALIHFALGIFWKASVHSWKQESTAPRIDLGLQSEGLRMFLRGEGCFPQDMALHLEVSPPPVGTIAFTDPIARRTTPKMYYFYVPGMFFSLWMGSLTDEQRISCLVSNWQWPVTAADKTHLVMLHLRGLAKTARKSDRMQKIIRSREIDGQRRFTL